MIIGTLSCKKPLVPTKKDKTEVGDGNEEKPSAFVGTWDYTKIDLSDGKLTLQGQEVGSFTGNGKNIVGEVVISENPNVYSTELQFTAAVDIDLGFQTQQQDMPVEKRTSTGTWTESNGQISLKDDNGNNVTIISSSDSKIVFSGNFTEKLNFEQLGFALDANADATFTIEK